MLSRPQRHESGALCDAASMGLCRLLFSVSSELSAVCISLKEVLEPDVQEIAVGEPADRVVPTTREPPDRSFHLHVVTDAGDRNAAQEARSVVRVVDREHAACVLLPRELAID